jgi:hypothetical protein
MDTPEPPDAAGEGQGVYRELVEMMMLFCLECEWLEAKETKAAPPLTTSLNP